ncbi:hypothetical protein GYMLUDRAFT_245405 [Collybiopsis luxurians FD-317 M1]|uniref:Uncharacterized protein n=1 Tax=Collybiopsis luxurians FD-317 M1 TaxID=944289 RepID=A0A0D0BUZ4_9AGAR|nr:hypothetical protein GYMLUDRAFT_245405 [Collybiopsis luxurians FD-317 M1]
MVVDLVIQILIYIVQCDNYKTYKYKNASILFVSGALALLNSLDILLYVCLLLLLHSLLSLLGQIALLRLNMRIGGLISLQHLHGSINETPFLALQLFPHIPRQLEVMGKESMPGDGTIVRCSSERADDTHTGKNGVIESVLRVPRRSPSHPTNSRISLPETSKPDPLNDECSHGVQSQRRPCEEDRGSAEQKSMDTFRLGGAIFGEFHALVEGTEEREYDSWVSDMDVQIQRSVEERQGRARIYGGRISASGGSSYTSKIDRGRLFTSGGSDFGKDLSAAGTFITCEGFGYIGSAGSDVLLDIQSGVVRGGVVGRLWFGREWRLE